MDPPTDNPQSTELAEPSHTGTEQGRGDRGNKRSWRGREGKETGGRGRRNKEKGRKEWAQDLLGRRERTQETKRRRLDAGEANRPIYAVQFTEEEIAKDERKPKRKVAVMIGYSGSGYKGMQLNDKEKTIEGDLFGAFVAAGAISKANADDPKKSALVRCARTDKGVHAAGNIISLKLIVEDKDIVQKINSHLPPQIRVWGFERTSSSFSAYQLCESRIYEYLIPTHCFLPPHPKTFLGKKLVELADEAGDREAYEKRQEEVASFWQDAEDTHIKSVLDQMDPDIRAQAMKIIFEGRAAEALEAEKQAMQDSGLPQSPLDQNEGKATTAEEEKDRKKGSVQHENRSVEDEENGSGRDSVEVDQGSADRVLTPLESAIRTIRLAYNAAKLAYRISDARRARVQSVLGRFLGTQNYHNYTINKSPHDHSAQRVIKSFVAADKPIVINNTEWLSLKVHGQSFMMHQIRKMVSMCALMVRCGTHEGRIQDSFLANRVSIPKAPGLGLLLERPIFDAYNDGPRLKSEVALGKVSFERFEKEVEEFKAREIYERIFREEERDGQFSMLFASIDSLRSPVFLYLSSLGLDGTKIKLADGVEGKDAIQAVNAGLDEEDEDEGMGEG